MAKKKLFYLCVTYPTADMVEWRDKNDRVYAALGHPDAAGTMLDTGLRDNSWYDLTQGRAEEMQKKARALGVEGLLAHVREQDFKGGE